MLPETTWIVVLIFFSRERTVDQAELVLNNMLTNENNWTFPEPTPKPTPKKRGILFLSPENMQETKKSMK